MSCNPPYERGTGIVCGCNCKCCPPLICNNPKILWRIAENCKEITLTETDIICEDGLNKVYKRNIIIRLRDWYVENVSANCCQQ
jgi:hypothetical protein